MLIVDMPMPEKCEKCPLIFRCAEMNGITTGSFISAKHDGYLENFCIIKGELVRCGECKHFDGENCCERNGIVVWDMKTWFCADGERRVE